MKAAAHGAMSADFVKTCPGCGKLAYSSRDQAKRAAKAHKNQGRKLRPYRCGDLFHLTSMPAAAVGYYRERGQW